MHAYLPSFGPVFSVLAILFPPLLVSFTEQKLEGSPPTLSGNSVAKSSAHFFSSYLTSQEYLMLLMVPLIQILSAFRASHSLGFPSLILLIIYRYKSIFLNAQPYIATFSFFPLHISTWCDLIHSHSSNCYQYASASHISSPAQHLQAPGVFTTAYLTSLLECLISTLTPQSNPTHSEPNMIFLLLSKYGSFPLFPTLEYTWGRLKNCTSLFKVPPRWWCDETGLKIQSVTPVEWRNYFHQKSIFF